MLVEGCEFYLVACLCYTTGVVCILQKSSSIFYPMMNWLDHDTSLGVSDFFLHTNLFTGSHRGSKACTGGLTAIFKVEDKSFI